LIYKRCLHVVQENDRVVETVQRLRGGDMELVGQLMGESHASLRDLYEVSCAELDAMVRIAQTIEGCYGARLTGAGFGGCTVNLVARENSRRFAEELAASYEAETGNHPEIYISHPSDGAALLR